MGFRVPSDNPAAAEIHDGRQIQPAFGRGNISDVSDPGVIDPSGLGQGLEPIGCDGLIVLAVGGARAPGAFLQATEAAVAHQASHAMTPDRLALSTQLPMNPWSAIGVAAARV